MLDFITGLLLIIMIDLVLAGDNAVVIGMAARNVPESQRKKVIIWGTIGAIAIRIAATLIVVWLLEIPGLHLAGGLLLIWIAYKLLISDSGHDSIKAKSSVLQAIGTIIVADMAMGLDNVIAIAGASHGSFTLVIVGLLISVPIMVFGSTLVMKLMDRYAFVIYIGAGILAWTAGKMVVAEDLLSSVIDPLSYGKYVLEAVIVAVVLLAGKARNAKRVKMHVEV